MPETSSFVPEEASNLQNKKSKRRSASSSPEAMASALAKATEEIEKARRIEASRQRILARLDLQIAEKEAKAVEKVRGEMGVLKGKLAKSKEEKQKLKEKGEDAYESFEVSVPPAKVISSEGGSASGEIDNDHKLGARSGGRETNKDVIKQSERRDKREENAKLDRIFKAYEEASSVGDFADFMLKHSDMALTKERAESDPAIKKYLESKFDEEKTGIRYEDLAHALPTEEDYKENAFGRELEEDAEKEPQRKKSIPSMPELQEFGVIEEKPPIGVAVRDLRMKLKKHADSKKPSKATEEAMASLKNLPPAEESIEEEIGEIRSEDVVEVTDLEPPTSKEKPSKFASKREEESGSVEAKYPTLEKARARVAAMPEAARKRAEAGPLVKKLSGMSTKEGVEHVSREVALGKQKLLDQIAERYVKKLGTKENARQFLMGPEVKGWFKGGQRKDQENYKKIDKELHG